VRRLDRYQPDALFDVAFSVRSGGSLLPLPLGTEHTEQTLRLLTDAPVARRFAELDELSREEATLGPPKRWVALEPERVALMYRREAVAREAGALLQRRLADLAPRMVVQIKNVIGIEYYVHHSGGGIDDGRLSDEALE